MKKIMLFAAVAAIAASASVASVQAKGIGGPGGMGGGKNSPNGPYPPGGGGGYPNKPGCCGGFTGNHHWGWGGGFTVGLVNAGGGDCYYVRRNVVVPGIGVVSKRQLVCE
jgi:hypothetical protein